MLVVVPSAVPYIVTGMRVAMASSFMSIIPAEILAADSGIGYLLQQSSMLLQTNRIFVALLTICVLGFVVDRIFRLVVDKVLPATCRLSRKPDANREREPCVAS